MNEIGILWQTDTITPAQEHFISHLIRQKLIAAIDQQDLFIGFTKGKSKVQGRRRLAGSGRGAGHQDLAGSTVRRGEHQRGA